MKEWIIYLDYYYDRHNKNYVFRFQAPIWSDFKPSSIKDIPYNYIKSQDYRKIIGVVVKKQELHKGNLWFHEKLKCLMDGKMSQMVWANNLEPLERHSSDYAISWNEKISTFDIETDVLYDAIYTPNDELKILNVGHGLSIFDKKNKVIFDCGGSASLYTYWKEQFKNVFKNTKGITVIISHTHSDHILYLEKLIGKNDPILQQISTVLIDYGMPAPNSLEKLGAKLWKIEEGILSMQGWDIHSKHPNFNKNVWHDNCLMASRNDFLATGDASYKKISLIMSNHFDKIQVPHHGSLGWDTGFPTVDYKTKCGFVSANGRYGLPDKRLNKYYKDLKYTNT